MINAFLSMNILLGCNPFIYRVWRFGLSYVMVSYRIKSVSDCAFGIFSCNFVLMNKEGQVVGMWLNKIMEFEFSFVNLYGQVN